MLDTGAKCTTEIVCRENVLRMKRSKHVNGIVMYYDTAGAIPPGKIVLQNMYTI